MMGTARHLRFWLVAATLLHVAPPAGHGAEAVSGTGASASSGLDGRPPEVEQFRRVFAPLDRIAEVTRGRERFLPIPRAEFERLVNAPRGDEAPAVRVPRATWQARLEGGRLVQGTAELDVQHAGAGPAWLPIETRGLAIANVRWTDDRKAAAGTYHRADGDRAEFGIIVAEHGTLRIAWSASGRRIADGTEFRLTFPNAATTEFTVIAPATMRLSADVASILAQSSNAAGAVEHRLAVRGGTALSLRATPRSGDDRRGRVAVRHVTTYDVSPSAVQVESQLRIAPFAQPVRELALSIPSSLQILDLMLGGQSLGFTETPAPNGSDEKVVTIVLGQPLPAGETELRVRGIMSTKLDSPMKLAPPALARSTWLGGTMHLAVSDGLHLRDLLHNGFRPDVSGAAENVSGKRWTFAQTVPQASLQVRLARSPERLLAQVLTSVEIDREDVTADATADLTSDYGAESIVRAELATGWEISSVESQPAGLVRSWSIEGKDRRRSVTVVLDRPVTPERPVRLRFKGRRARPADESSLSARQLALLRFDHLSGQEQWVEVVAGGTQEVFLDGTASAQTVTTDELPAGLRELVRDPSEAHLLAVRHDAEDVLFRTRPRSAELTTEVEVDAEVSRSSIRYRYRIRIEPRSGVVNRLGIVFSEAAAETPQWRFVDGSGSDLAAELVADDDEANGAAVMASRALRWRLGQPQSEPFDLFVTLAHEWGDSSPLVLAAVDSPGSQVGKVYVSADRSVRVGIENRGLEPVIVPPPNEAGSPAISSAYRFQPERILLRDGESPLVIRRVAAAEQPPAAWIRTARLDSVYLPNGRIASNLSIALENHAPEQLDLHLPSANRILYRAGEAAWRQVASTSRSGSVTIPVPGDEGSGPLEVRFSQRRRPLGSFAWVQPVPLKFSFPVGSVDRRVWAPASYRAIALESPAERLLAGFYVFGDWDADTGAAAPPLEFMGNHIAREMHELRFASGAGLSLELVHVTSLRLWCAAMGGLGLVLGGYVSRARKRMAIVLASAGFGAALLLPIPFAPPASALAWGCLGAVLIQILLAPLASLVRQLLRTERRSREAMATTIVLLCSLSLLPEAPSAEGPADEPPTAMYRVIDPIDQNRKPAGDHVFVPESLYSSLLGSERERIAPVGRWLIKRCRVRGTLADVPPQGSGGLQTFSVLVELETFHRDAEVRLPLPREASSDRVASIRVDGTEPANSWSEDGNWLNVRIAQPGPHHLELLIVPRVLRKGGIGELSLPLVAAAETHLEIAVPEDMPDVTFRGVLGEVMYLPASSTYRGFVGPIRELVMNWQAPKSSSTTDTPVEVLAWLYVQRTATLIEQRLVVHAGGEDPLYVDVIPPADIQFLPSARELPYARITAASGGDRVSLVIQPQGDDSVVIPLQFLYEHPAGASSLPVPRFAMEGGLQVIDRWFAIQAASGVVVNPQPGTSAEFVEPDEFLDRWGPAETPPAAAFREQGDVPAWRIGFDAEGARVQATESTIAVARPRGVDVFYRADCRVQHGAVLLQRIDVPSALIISQVQTLQDGAVREATWSNAENGRVRILLPEPISGNFTLRINGTIPADERGNILVPVLSLDAVKGDAPRITAARAPGTVLELERSDALQPVANASLPASWQDDWHLHGQYTWSASPAGAAFVRGRVSRAEPPREVRTVTTLVPELRRWKVDVHCLVQGIGQPLDRLVFFAPKEWEGPHAVDPAGRWRLNIHEEATHNRFVLKPIGPAAGEVRVTLRGQIPQARQDLVTVPSIRVVEPAADEGLVALPATLSGAEAAWETEHLVAMDDAKGLVETIGDAGEWRVYRTTPEPATPRVSLLEQSPSAPLISFVEAVVRLATGQSIYGEATFTLDPRGRRSCEVAVPVGHRLLDVQVNGRRPSVYRAAPRRWQVQLESSQLPQLITLAFQSERSAAGETLPLHAPRLLADGVPIPVVQTAWNIQCDEPWRAAGTEADGPRHISGSMLAAVRTANLVESLDEMVPALVGSPSPDSTRWLDYWRGRIAAAHDRYGVRARSEPNDRDAARAIEAAQARLAGIADTLSPWAGTMEEEMAGGQEQTGSSALAARRAGEWDLRLLGEGSIDAIELRPVRGREDQFFHRLLGTVLLCVVGGGLASVRRRDRIASIWGRTDAAFAVLFGAALVALFMGRLWAIAVVLAAGAAVLGWSIGLRGYSNGTPGGHGNGPSATKDGGR